MDNCAVLYAHPLTCFERINLQLQWRVKLRCAIMIQSQKREKDLLKFNIIHAIDNRNVKSWYHVIGQRIKCRHAYEEKRREKKKKSHSSKLSR